MSGLTEHELSAVLDRAVGEPPPAPDRIGEVRRRARRSRRRRRGVVAGTMVLAGLAAAVPSVLDLQPDSGPVPGPAGRSRTVDLAAIERPLRLPTLAPGQACPVSPSRRLPAGGGFSSSHRSRGEGPFYLDGTGTVPVNAPRTTNGGGRWRDQKVIWVVDKSYAGPLLVRGGRVDRPGPLRFMRYIGAAGYDSGPGDDRPVTALRYDWYFRAPSSDRLVRGFPSVIYVRRPGCYAVQVDGVGFSSTVVFRVVGGRAGG